MTDPDFDSMDDDAFEEYISENPSLLTEDVSVADDEVDESEDAVEDTEVDETTEETPTETEKETTEVSDIDKEEEIVEVSETTSNIDTEDEDTEDTQPEFEVSAEDAQKQLKVLFAPFKANGSEMSIRSVEEAVTMMQMGANYTKKMTAIKPHLKRVQTLEHNNISDTDISMLVDLKQGNKAAIKKLLADNNIDAMDLDLDETDEYSPNDYSISQSQFDLNSAIEEIRDSEAYPETIRILGTEWDDSSREEIAKNPSLVKGMHDQVANGDYKIVKAEIERERALGRLTNVNDLDAYVQTFKRLSDMQQAGNTANVAPESNGKKVDPKEAARKKAKAAAATTKAKTTTALNATDVPDLSRISDEDFEKLYAKEYDF